MRKKHNKNNGRNLLFNSQLIKGSFSTQHTSQDKVNPKKKYFGRNRIINLFQMVFNCSGKKQLKSIHFSLTNNMSFSLNFVLH